MSLFFDGELMYDVRNDKWRTYRGTNFLHRISSICDQALWKGLTLVYLKRSAKRDEMK